MGLERWPFDFISFTNPQRPDSVAVSLRREEQEEEEEEMQEEEEEVEEVVVVGPDPDTPAAG